MRTVGNQLLDGALVGIPESATITVNSPQPITHTKPPPSVLPDQPATTKAEKSRQRLTWTYEMNRHIMHCYYHCTKIETIKIGYREELLQQFLTKYPHLSSRVTAQRIMDQKRAIVTRKLISDIELQTIKEQTATEINTLSTNNLNQQSQQNIQPQQTTPSQISHITTELNSNYTILHDEMHNTAEQNTYIAIINELEMNIEKWTGTKPSSRSPLPKLIPKANTENLIQLTNQYISIKLEEQCILEDIHLIIYSAALTVLTLNKQIVKSNIQRKTQKQKPKWQIRIENRINNIRRELGRLTQYVKGNRSTKIHNHITTMKQQNKATILETIDTLKQKLRLYAARLRRYKEAAQRKIDHKLFYANEKQFYRRLNSKETELINTPTKQEIENY